jgi:hypothetical protein
MQYASVHFQICIKETFRVKTKSEIWHERSFLKMYIRDRFTRGWVAGACGGLLGGILGFLPYYIGISTMRLSDWSAILIFGREPPFSFVDQVYAVFVLALSTGTTGIIFAFLLLFITEENIYFKGWIIFLFPWWIIYLLTALAKTEGTLNLSVMTTFSDGISTTIIGLVAVYSYRLLEPKS